MSESIWRDFWERTGVYRYDPARPRSETFVVDTPPPTASGELHIGSVCSYTHTDLMVRHRRMRGDNVFYPMGWDDNGLPTERRVQNVFNVRPDVKLHYDPDLDLAFGRKGETIFVSRQNFIDLCDRVIREDEEQFRKIWERVALSVDWSITYATIDRRCRFVSQWSFVKLIQKGEAELREAPTMWDVDHLMAIAQAEVDDREEDGALRRVRFGVEGGGDVLIATTRPELLAACIAVIAHPDDGRYKALFGKNAVTPLYGATVPIIAHEAAEPDKGTGIMMVCTFGDAADVERWKELGVPPRAIVDRQGRITGAPWGGGHWVSVDASMARRYHGALVGLPVAKAREEVVRQLGEAGLLDGQPVPVRRPVKFYEKGDRPLEYVTSRQWFIRLLDHRDALLEQGRKVVWHPDSMLKRYETWVEGLNYDWPVSRQRPFGVPIPVWYAVDEDGSVDHSRLLLPSKEELPIDPSSDVPHDFTEEQRGKPGGFVGDPDVFDTWATSSLTPIILTGWPDDPERHARLYPADVRPNAHDIIRTWDFYTILRSYLEDGSIPWYHAAISGFVVSPDRKKMSKSKGNVVVPSEYFDEYGTDAVRYWSASARLGIDPVVDPNVFKEGKRLITKLRNAARFVNTFEGAHGPPARPLDLALLARLRGVIERATSAWDAWDHASGLEAAEAWFWADFCDNYLELVKARAYAGDAGAVGTLRRGLDVVTRLLAPVLPYVTEEIWNGGEVPSLPEGSVHRASWPVPEEVAEGVDDGCFDAAVEVLTQIRRAKSDAKVSIRVPVDSLVVRGPKARLDLVAEALEELEAAGNVRDVSLVVDSREDLVAEVTLGTPGR